MKKERDSGIELLRIFAMFMVIGVHLLLYGNYFSIAIEMGGKTQEAAVILKLFLRCAVNIFIIITGFFSVRSKSDFKKTYKRVLKIYSSILFYSIVLSLLTIFLGENFRTIEGTAYSVSEIIIKMFFPVSSQCWYFLTNYILLMLIVPFLNITLNNITKKQYTVLLIILGYIMSVWLFIGKLNIFKNVASDYGYDMIIEGKNIFSFIFLYIIGGYISLHIKATNKPKIRYLVLAISTVAINYLLLSKLNPEINYVSVAYGYANPLVILCAVFIFLFFKDLHFKSKIINMLGSTTIGVYAISEFSFFREWLWNIFDFTKFNCSNTFKTYLKILGVILIIFLGCSIIDLLRQRLFSRIESIYKKLRKTE